MSKGEIACFEQFLNLSRCFQKSSVGGLGLTEYNIEKKPSVWKECYVEVLVRESLLGEQAAMMLMKYCW